MRVVLHRKKKKSFPELETNPATIDVISPQLQEYSLFFLSYLNFVTTVTVRKQSSKFSARENNELKNSRDVVNDALHGACKRTIFEKECLCPTRFCHASNQRLIQLSNYEFHVQIFLELSQ